MPLTRNFRTAYASCTHGRASKASIPREAPHGRPCAPLLHHTTVGDASGLGTHDQTSRGEERPLIPSRTSALTQTLSRRVLGQRTAPLPHNLTRRGQRAYPEHPRGECWASERHARSHATSSLELSLAETILRGRSAMKTWHTLAEYVTTNGPAAQITNALYGLRPRRLVPSKLE